MTQQIHGKSGIPDSEFIHLTDYALLHVSSKPGPEHQ